MLQCFPWAEWLVAPLGICLYIQSGSAFSWSSENQLQHLKPLDGTPSLSSTEFAAKPSVSAWEEETGGRRPPAGMIPVFLGAGLTASGTGHREGVRTAAAVKQVLRP